MDLNRDFLRLFTGVFGLLVLLSYVYGVSRANDAQSLWGGIPSTWQNRIVPFMFIAAIGYLIYWWIVLFQLEPASLENMHWPWSDSDGLGLQNLFIANALVLIPSALWLESTLFHINHQYSWTPILVIGILFLVSLGNFLMGALAYSSYQDSIDGSRLMLVGSLMLAIQCILFDFIIWSAKFPWK
ncbi:MAG TPA: hypothetical protein QF508_06145 [Candidatus Thalassarchaeaceae archaeon]|jgi:hypothetical protein|nr:hypothetical protein [Candidatus Thalassarchaeaceae archaeon]HJO42964.1 hypothetical protein [Candidatus Thalassarchaeaceae archaeon]